MEGKKNSTKTKKKLTSKTETSKNLPIDDNNEAGKEEDVTIDETINTKETNIMPENEESKTIVRSTKKTDSEGYLVDGAGNRVIVDGQPIRLRKMKKYNAEAQLLDDAGNVVINKRTGQPIIKPAREASKRTFAKKLRNTVDHVNEVISMAKSQGISFQLHLDNEATAPLSMDDIMITERI